MDQKTNYVFLSVTESAENRDFIYPVVNIRRCVNDFGPEEAFAERIANGLALPDYELIAKIVVALEIRLYTLFLKDGVRRRLQLPEGKSFRVHLFGKPTAEF